MKARFDRGLVVIAILAMCLTCTVQGSETTDAPYRLINADGQPYRTPRAGEAFRVRILNRLVTVPPRDRRSVSAWHAGLTWTNRRESGSQLTPSGALYFWRHPDNRALLRAIVAGVYNDIFLAYAPPSSDGFEIVGSLQTFTAPIGQAPVIRGEEREEEKQEWGYLYPGCGIGYRRDISPGNQENMLAASLLFEPGFLYFTDTGHHGARSDVPPPRDTMEERMRFQVRLDALERNLLELPHAGFACGGDAVVGRRDRWEDWGIRPEHTNAAPGDGRQYARLTLYGLTATPVPFAGEETHRLVCTLHAGVADGVDRFSCDPLGGGPWPRGQEYGSTARPVLGGAMLREFSAKHYCVGTAAYRWEPVFFTHLSFNATLAYLEHGDRLDRGAIESDVMKALGMTLTTGFIGSTRLNVDYSYNFDLPDRDTTGGHALVTQLSRRF